MVLNSGIDLIGYLNRDVIRKKLQPPPRDFSLKKPLIARESSGDEFEFSKLQPKNSNHLLLPMKTGNRHIRTRNTCACRIVRIDLRQVTNKGTRDLDANQSVAMKTRNNQSIKPKAVV